MIGIFGKNENRIGRLNSNLSFKIPNKSNNFVKTISHMDALLKNKLKGLFWDMPPGKRDSTIKNIINNPIVASQDEQTAIRMLNSLSWYELIQLLGIQEVKRLLSDQFINKLYPHQRRIFYSSAKQLLSKYNLPTTG